MVRLGTRKMADGPFPVLSVGTGAGDGFIEVARLRGSELTSTNSHWAFIVWGRFGSNVVDFGSITTGTQSLIEVALGDQTGFVNLNYKAAAGIIDAQLVSHQWTGVPFFFMVVLDGATAQNWFKPGIGAVTTWDTNDDLVLYARVASKEGSGVSAAFLVSDVTFLAFDLDRIGGSSYHVDQLFNPAPQANNINSEGWKDWFANSGSMGGVGQDWLHFWYIKLNPVAPFESIWTQFGYLTDGLFSSFTPVVGTSLFGQRPHGPGNSTGIRTQDHWGGFWPLTQPTGTGFRPAVRSRDRHNLTGLRSTWHLIRTFSVRIENFAHYRAQTHQEFERATSGNSLSHFLPFEIIVPTGSEYTVLHQGIVERPQALQPSDRCFTPVAFAEGSARLLRTVYQYVGTSQPGTGVPCLTMVPEALTGAPGTPVESRYQFHYFERPQYAATRNENWDVLDAASVGFYFDDDPQAGPDPIPPPPPPVIIVPGREAVDPSSLNELPIAPDALSIEEAPEASIVEHLADQGVRRTWPMGTEPRKLSRWTWENLSESEHETLEAFIDANPTFKWTPPEETEAAYAWTSLQEWLPLPRRKYSLSMSVGKLIQTGGS